MAIFSYKGIDRKGKEIKGNITSDNLALAKQKIISSGVMLINIEEKKSVNTNKITIGSKVNIQELSLMTRQLATLISAKIPIAESLSALVDQVDHPTLRVVLSEVKQKINEGSSLAKSLSDYPKIFDNIYVNMVEAGEASGTLHIVLIRLADFTEGQSRLKNKIIGAMLYPIIMMSVGGLMMIFIFVTIIPKLAKLFVSMKQNLPWPTKLCIGISNFLQNYWIGVIIFIIFFIITMRWYLNTENGKDKWHHLQLRIPILGEIITMLNVGRFCSTLATLLNSGVPILLSLKIVKNLISNVHMQRTVDESRAQVSEGASLTGPLISSGLFPPLVTHMIKLGEKSGELETLLEIVAKNYEEQVNNKLGGLTTTLEPIMIILMGCGVAFVVLSVVIPMMSLTSLKH
ncbi:MAG: type II secretion system inner membrane protein GspF [Oligoflexia bacterium]|nr:type II secretion system inner membrane protein GspF [Oligoflexia bacterium]